MNFWIYFKTLLEQFIFSENMWRILGAVGVIILSFLFRKFFVRLILNLFKKLTTKTETNIDDMLLEILEKPARLAFIILGFYLAGQIMEFSPTVDIFLGRVTRSLILFAFFWAAFRATDTFSLMFEKFTNKKDAKLDNMLLSFLNNSIKIAIAIIGSVSVIQVWFKEIAGILTGVGLGGLVLALAAQDTASNIFGSITIMLDRPFNIGDWIQTPHVEGTVEDMGFRSTRVRTFSQSLVTIPNSVLAKDIITNWSKMGKRRITYSLGLTYNTTPQQLTECITRLRQMLKDHPEVHPETIYVYFEKFGENSLDIFLYFFTKTTNWQKHLETREDINLKIMDILKDLGLKVAFPSRSIYIENPEALKKAVAQQTD